MRDLAPAEVERLAGLVERAMPDERLTVDELLAVCWDEGGVVLATPDDDGAVVAVVRSFGDFTMAWVKLVVVVPEARRRGQGTALMAAAETWAFDNLADEVHLAGSAPWYLWPGVPTDALGMMCLAEARGFEPLGAEVNMSLLTTFRAAAPDGVSIERVLDDELVTSCERFVERHWPSWLDEVRRGIDQGGTHAALDGGEPVGFACHSVNRAGWVGPMGSVPSGRGRGIGHALLSALCTDLMVAGHDHAEVSWVGPVRFYAKAGASVSRTFRTYRKRRP